jgi:hypothetical protein
MLPWKSIFTTFIIGLLCISNPASARFVSNDPVTAQSHLQQGNIQGFNRYAYGNNNPYKFTDPDGRNPLLVLVYAPEIIALTKATALVGSATAVAYGGSEAINQYNKSEGSDAEIQKVKDGKKTAGGDAGSKGQLEGTGGQEEALSDLGSLTGVEGTEWESADGARTGKMLTDGTKANIHPSAGGGAYPQGTSTLELNRPKGKGNVKIRYPKEKE